MNGETARGQCHHTPLSRTKAPTCATTRRHMQFSRPHQQQATKIIAAFFFERGLQSIPIPIPTPTKKIALKKRLQRPRYPNLCMCSVWHGKHVSSQSLLTPTSSHVYLHTTFFVFGRWGATSKEAPRQQQHWGGGGKARQVERARHYITSRRTPKATTTKQRTNVDTIERGGGHTGFRPLNHSETTHRRGGERGREGGRKSLLTRRKEQPS